MTSQPYEIPTEVLGYVEHMPSGDDLVLIVLKGHLLLEQQLEEIIKHVVAHGDLLGDVALRYQQKVGLARAMCWGKHDSPMWAFIVALNTLRNDYAHSLGSDKTEARLKTALKTHEATLDAEQLKEIEGQGTPDRLRHAIIHTLGFLSSYRRDAVAYRKRIDVMYKFLDEKNSE